MRALRPVSLLIFACGLGPSLRIRHLNQPVYPAIRVGLPVFTFRILLAMRQPSRPDQHDTFVYSLSSRARRLKPRRLCFLGFAGRCSGARRPLTRPRAGRSRGAEYTSAPARRAAYRSSPIRPPAFCRPAPPLCATSIRTQRLPVAALCTLHRRYGRSGHAGLRRRLCGGAEHRL